MRQHLIQPIACTGVALLLAACAVEPQADGSTKVHLSLSGAAKPAQDNAQNSGSAVRGQPPAVVEPAKTAPPPVPTTSRREPEAPKPMDAKAAQMLEQALSCATLGKSFGAAESALQQAGWRSDQGVTPVQLAQPLKVFGLGTQKIAVSRDGGEQVYRSYLPGVSLQQAVKAASLKLGKDRKTYGRLTKLGVLTVDTENGETTLTCTVDSEQY